MRSLCLTSAILFSLGAACLAGNVPSQQGAKTIDSAASGYRILKTFKVGGEGRWDYLTIDADTRRLFVTHSTHVVVLNADTGALVGRIADTPGVHGVALVPELGRGFTSNGKANTATIFALDTLEVLGTVETGENPDAIVYEPTTKRIFTMNGRSHDATAIDAATGKAVGRIELGGKPEFAVGDGAGKLYVNLEDKSEIAVLDPHGLKVTARWSLSPGEAPSGLAIDKKNRRLFSVCENQMMVVLDADAGTVLAALPIGEGSDGAAFDPTANLAFSSNGEGTLTIVNEDSPSTFSVVQNVTTMRGARTIALDLKTQNVFLPTAEFVSATESTNGNRHSRPGIVPGSFRLIVVGK